MQFSTYTQLMQSIWSEGIYMRIYIRMCVCTSCHIPKDLDKSRHIPSLPHNSWKCKYYTFTFSQSRQVPVILKLMAWLNHVTRYLRQCCRQLLPMRAQTGTSWFPILAVYLLWSNGIGWACNTETWDFGVEFANKLLRVEGKGCHTPRVTFPHRNQVTLQKIHTNCHNPLPTKLKVLQRTDVT